MQSLAQREVACGGRVCVCSRPREVVQLIKGGLMNFFQNCEDKLFYSVSHLNFGW